MFVVVSYDIPLDHRRTKVMKVLKNFGDHVQESVFECNLKPEVYKRMLAELEKLIAPKEDSVRLYFINEADIARILSLGIGPFQRPKGWVFIAEKPRRLPPPDTA